MLYFTGKVQESRGVEEEKSEVEVEVASIKIQAELKKGAYVPHYHDFL